jgi:hypothetical protein
LVLGGYAYLSNNLNANAADSAISSSNGLKTNGKTSGGSDQISKDTAFLYTLTSLTKIKIDTSLFTDTAFNLLTDNTVVLEPGTPGRPNPFAPISGIPSTDVQKSLVVTNVPDQITKTSAVLNGTTNNTTGVTSVYFEYGPTPTLGKFTKETKQSLIGTFGSNITGLTPDTVYFFRAVAKINGVLQYGDVIPFNTNN